MRFLNISLGQPALIFLIMALLFLVILLAGLYWQAKGKLALAAKQVAQNDQILKGLKIQEGLEANLSAILDLLVPLFPVDGYYFYVLEAKSQRYLLKVSRQGGNTPLTVGVSYSGLSEFNKERYHPPLGLNGLKTEGQPAIIRDGEVPLLELPVSGGAGLVRLGPLRHISKSQSKIMHDLGYRLEPVLNILLAIDKLKNDAEVVIATNKAVTDLSKSSFTTHGLVNQLMALSTKMADAGGCCLIRDDGSPEQIALLSGLDQKAEAQLRSDPQTVQVFVELIQDRDTYWVSQTSKDFFQMPYYLVAAGVKALLLVKIPCQEGRRIAVFWYYGQTELEKHRIAAVRMLLLRMEHALNSQAKFQELTETYTEELKFLVESIDNLDPHTVGHSTLIAKFAGAIAREQHLSDGEIAEIELAAYLHDVGVLGFSSSFLFKPGKYNAVEFETMKLHAEVGAAMIESTIGNSTIAAYIRYHHERWDGFGYPSGLKGKQIPAGARIIAVADMFNAKISGRRYRAPAAFDRAVSDMLAASGTQLDPMAVQALINWLSRKRSDPARRGRPLQPCWQLRCCPSHIRQNCTAYPREELNCWDLNNTNCTAHGNECATCFVYTETSTREVNMVLVQ